MADKQENQMNIVESPTYIRGLDASGNSIIIPLSSVLKGTIIDKRSLNNSDDLNNIYVNGIYSIIPENTLPQNYPSGAERSILFVFSSETGHAAQIVISTNGRMWFRATYNYTSASLWCAWKSVSYT